MSGRHTLAITLARQAQLFQALGEMLETGLHLQSLQAVLEGRQMARLLTHGVDVLASAIRTWRERLRVIDMFGPSTIPPVVASTRLMIC